MNIGTQVFGFGWNPEAGLDEIFRSRSMMAQWREIAGGAYLCLVDDFDLDRFLNDLPKRFPSIAPHGADLTRRDFELMIFPGAIMLAYAEELPRWDDGLETVRNSLANELLIYPGCRGERSRPHGGVGARQARFAGNVDALPGGHARLSSSCRTAHRTQNAVAHFWKG